MPKHSKVDVNFWSKGLKKLLSIVETTDEELANKEEQEDAPMISAVVSTNFGMVNTKVKVTGKSIKSY
jgi:hypothetical protein